jgi:hypothetical protein
VSPFVRTVKTASGPTAVQIVYTNRRGSRDIQHIGSAHDEARLELLKAAARQRLRPARASWSWVSPALVVSAGGVVAGSMVGRCRLCPRGWRTCGMRSVRSSACSGSMRPARATRCPGPDDRAVQQARRRSGAGGDRHPALLLPDAQAPVTGLRPPVLAAGARRCLRGACGLSAASLVLFDVSTLVLLNLARGIATSPFRWPTRPGGSPGPGPPPGVDHRDATP